jgi:hypothetical protein
VTGAGAVVALVLLEWSVGWIGAAAWTQSWSVVTRGHFRITAWGSLLLGVLAYLAYRSQDAVIGTEVGSRLQAQDHLVVAFLAFAAAYLAAQYSNTDVPGVVIGYLAAAVGVAALCLGATLIAGWPFYLAALSLVAGAGVLGAVTNGMMLGHWYLNQPGLKTWALGRLTVLGLAVTGLSAALGIGAYHYLTSASTHGAGLGIPGFGDSFGVAFFAIWLGLSLFTGAVVWAARRCVQIRSIQSATGLYYVAILTAGVAEFLVRYLMVNAT